MLNQIQLDALAEIERQVRIIRTSDTQIIEVTGPLQEAINAAPAGSTLDMLSKSHETIVRISKPLTIRNGIVLAPANANDVVNITNTGVGVRLQDLTIRGNGNTKNGIVAHGRNMDFDNIKVENIRRVGQETHAIVMWDSPGPLIVRNSKLEAGSICFLAGGAKTTVPNTIPTDLSFDNVTFTRPVTWKGQGYACKNAFELKNARKVSVKNCILENVWAEGQAGSCIVLTPSSSGDLNSQETIVEDVLFEGCTIRNVGNGVNALGFTQQVEFPTKRGNNYRFIRNQWQITDTLGGHGTLVMVAHEPTDVIFEHNVVKNDGDAFFRIGDEIPVRGVRFYGNDIQPAGTYGVFAPKGNVRGIGWETICPGGVMESNKFTQAHATFKTNFPKNTYV